MPLGVLAIHGLAEGCEGVRLPDAALWEHEVEVLADVPSIVRVVKVQSHDVAVGCILEKGDVGWSGTEAHVS